MKKSLLLLLLLFSLLAGAQNKQSVVTLKNGTELTGVIKAIDPTDALTIVIAGIETTIKMADIASVKEAETPIAINATKETSHLLSENKLVVTDFAEYQESFKLQIGTQTLKMILVRGGDMNMGYDGKGSLSMNSEPVHKVGVTSFYISDTFVTSNIVSEVTGKSPKNGYYKATWEKAFEIVLGIGVKIGLPVRLPTEAEWEFAACSKEQSAIFRSCKDYEYCKDLFNVYNDLEYKVDPNGPDKGKFGRHVVRSYSQKKGKLSRMGDDLRYYFRLVIKAKDVHSINK